MLNSLLQNLAKMSPTPPADPHNSSTASIEDVDSPRTCPHGSFSRDGAFDCCNSEGHPNGSPGSDRATSQSFVSDIISSDNTTHESTHEDSTAGNAPSGERARTKRGRNGKKWVGLNWEHKEYLKEQNSGFPEVRFVSLF